MANAHALIILGMSRIIGLIWHRWLRRPYTLYRSIDEGEGSQTVVLLHGIGRTGNVWQHVVEGLTYLPVRIVAYDLLGFGQSPKPDELNYSVDDHATAVIASLEKLGTAAPLVLVGHSMGCLIAVRVARLRPDLVGHLVLYEMPLYRGLPEKRSYRLRLAIYSRIYQRIIDYKPGFDEANAKRIERLARRIVGFEITRDTWSPFVKSLENTVLQQSTSEDIRALKVPIDVIYGTRDMLVIRGKTKKIFGEDLTNVTTHNVRARHIISLKASKLIVGRISEALDLIGKETALVKGSNVKND